MVLLGSCGGHAPAGPGDDVLVLEVGGEADSLRAALAAAGLPVGAPRQVSDAAEPAAAPLPGVAPIAEPGPPPAIGPAEPPPPAPRAEPASRTVLLRRGQTLIHLAREHLGDGNRFREILALNGWTDADARRLPEGTFVRIPADAARRHRER